MAMQSKTRRSAGPLPEDPACCPPAAGAWPDSQVAALAADDEEGDDG